MTINWRMNDVNAGYARYQNNNTCERESGAIMRENTLPRMSRKCDGCDWRERKLVARIWQPFAKNTIWFIKIKCKYLPNQRAYVVLALHVAIVWWWLARCWRRCRCAILCQQRQHSKQWAKDKRQGNNKTRIHFAQEICMLITLWYSN